MRAAQRAGVRHILVTHPELPVISMPITVQIELAGLGAFFERCLLSVRAYNQYVKIANIADAIWKVGYETTVLATDFGQVHNPPPSQGMQSFVAELLGLGVQHTQMERMIKVNPRWLLGLSENSYLQP